MKKKQSNRKPAARLQFAPMLPGAVTVGLRKAENLLKEGDAEQALDTLADLEMRFPGYQPVLDMLMMGALSLFDMDRLLIALEGMLRIGLNREAVLQTLWGVYAMTGHPALALRAYHDLLREFPHALDNDPEVPQQLQELESAVRQDMLADELGIDPALAQQLAVLLDEAGLRMSQRRYPEVRAICERLLELQPEFPSALNNLAQSYAMEGKQKEAIAASERALVSDPDNIHALSNLTRLCFLSGDTMSARAYADRLKASKAKAFERTLKMMEGLAYLGDDEAILAIFEEEYALPVPKKRTIFSALTRAATVPTEDEIASVDPSGARAHHLAAAAACRLGKEEQALALWTRALELDPEIDDVQENLDDLARPVGEQNGPYTYSLRYWITQALIEDIQNAVESNPEYLDREKRSSQEDTPQNPFVVAIERHPELNTLIPALFDRGDSEGRKFALMFAGGAETPLLNEALRDFALGTRGTDTDRMQAAQYAAQVGTLDSGKIRMWMRGVWDDVMLFGTLIYTESDDGKHSPEVARLLEEGTKATNARDFGRADKLLHRAMEQEPDAPDILNNYAALLSTQGKKKECAEIIRRVHALDPEYFFGITNMAMLAIWDGDLETARTMLAELSKRRRMHYSEFKALARAQILLFHTMDDKKGEETWQDMLSSIEESLDSGPAKPTPTRRRLRSSR